MEFDELTPQEQEIFMEVAKSKIEDEVFMADGKNYFSLVTKGLVKEIPNANFLAASVILTKEGKKLRDKVLKKENNQPLKVPESCDFDRSFSYQKNPYPLHKTSRFLLLKG